jgi:hypothetical protein
MGKVIAGMLRLIFLTGVAALLSMSPASANADDTGSISGKVENFSSGFAGPSYYCFLEVYAYDSTGDVAASSSPVSGEYRLDGLPAGEYRLEFAGYCADPSTEPVIGLPPVIEFYKNKDTLAEATPVVVAAGEDTPDIDTYMGTNGSISGTITDSADNPLERVCVQAYDTTGSWAGSDSSDASGNYVIGGLATGDYRLQFHRCSNSSPNILGEFYDDKGTLPEATTVAVIDDSNTPEIDAELAAGGSISGTVTDATAGPSNGICVQTFDSTETPMGFALTGPDGTYVIEGLATGAYKVRFSECLGLKKYSVNPEFYEDSETLAQATPVSVTAGSNSPAVDADLATRPQHVTAPDTLIDSGPSATIATDQATFTFSSPDPGDTAKFQCRIDSGAFSDCSSPKTFSSLSDGPHTVYFRAEDPSGNQDQTPATRTFIVDTTVHKASITSLSVKGPVKTRKGRKSIHRVRITNSGDATATGVKLRVKGRGVSFRKAIGPIAAGATRTVKIGLVPKKAGISKLIFKVTSANAGARSIKRRLSVRRR